MNHRSLLPLSSILLAVSVGAQSIPDQPRSFLSRHAAFSTRDFEDLNRQRPVAKILDTKHSKEVAPIGVIRVDVPEDYFLTRFRDIENFKKSDEVLQIGKFSRPPQAKDLDRMTLDADDLESLKKCRPGDCGMKLPAAFVDRFSREIDPSAPDFAEQAQAFFRGFLVDYVRRYLAEGNKTLMTYVDKKESVSLAEESRSILEASPYLSEYFPPFLAYLHNHPAARPDRLEEFVYWSKEKFGFKSVVSISHVIICRFQSSASTGVMIASRQIYASHYFLGSLGLTAFLHPVQPASTVGTLIYLNRSRVDLMQGIFSGLLRFFVRRRIVGGLEKYLRLTRDRLEQEYRKPAPEQRPPRASATSVHRLPTTAAYAVEGAAFSSPGLPEALQDSARPGEETRRNQRAGGPGLEMGSHRPGTWYDKRVWNEESPSFPKEVCHATFALLFPGPYPPVRLSGGPEICSGIPVTGW